MVPERTTDGSMPSVSLSRFWLFLAVALPVLAALLAEPRTASRTLELIAGDVPVTTAVEAATRPLADV